MSAIYLILILIAVASYVVQQSLTSKFRKYSAMPLQVPMTGRDVAVKMLADNRITNVKVTSVGGTLTDHYNPATATVNLSDGVFAVNSVASAAVAAHECGHVLQHATAYGPLRLRTALVPAVNFASQWVSWVLLAGIMLVEVFPAVLVVALALFAVTTIFSFVTLPVEIDASRRAIAWLEGAGITQGAATEAARDALRAAAFTYVVAALSSLATLVYYGLLILGRRD